MLKLHTMNLTLLTRWVNRLMSLEEDSVMMVLKVYYDTWLDCERQATMTQGASVF